MRIFFFPKFHVFLKRERIPTTSIIDMVKQFTTGASIVSLGGGVYKQRLSREGKGKSSGYRIILCNKDNSRFFFLHGFSKSSLDNITRNELADLKKLAKTLFDLNDKQLDYAVAADALREYNEETI